MSRLARSILSSRFAVLPCLAVLLSLGAVAPASAQTTFEGRVLDAASGEPVVGALLVALDAEGRVWARSLTGREGGFALRISAGVEPTRVRVERIGYATQVFPAAELSPERVSVLRVTSSPVEIEGISAVAESLCGDEVRSGGGVHDLWTEARKSLRMTELSQSQRVLAFETERTVRSLAPDDLTVLEGTARWRRLFAERPYRSLPLEQMTARGWVEEAENGERIYWAPDASVLLSDEFTEQHCFSAEVTDEAVLLRFEPNRRRAGVPEIEGVMSLDPRTKELTALRFRYVGVPSRVGGGGEARSGGEAGGEIHFYGAPNGLRVVREWAIRMPVLAVIRTGFRGSTVEEVRVRHVREEGGRVVRIRTGEDEIELPRVREAAAPDSTLPTLRSRITKWSEDLGGERGVALHLRNDLPVALRVTGVELWDCRNVGMHCSRYDLEIVVEPGTSERLLVVPRDDILKPMEFQWMYAATNVR